MPSPPDAHAILAIVVTLFAIFLFTRERLRLESSSLTVLIVVLVWFEVAHINLNGVRLRGEDVLANFGNEALITISALLILAKGLDVTGALQPIGHVLSGLWKARPQVAFVATMLTAGFLSMFLNNTPVVAAILPLLVAVSLQASTPASTFKVLFVLIVLSHARRRILHFNVTEHPTAVWTARQLLEACGTEERPRYLIRDRDAIYGEAFNRQAAALRIKQTPTAPRSPWQNPYAERVIGSIRRECLDHVIVLGARHLRRVLSSYAIYYNGTRTHLYTKTLRKDERHSHWSRVG